MTAAELAYRANDDSVELRNQLVLSELPQVYYSARRIQERLPQQVELEDLVQAGVLGLIDAAARFDDAKDVKFATFAKFRINGAILDSLRKGDWGSRKLRRKSRAISVATAKIGSAVGRQATHDEIAAELGMTMEELHNTMTELNSLYLVGQISESSTDPGSMQDLIESAPDKGENNPFEACFKGENRALLVSALENLNEREQTLIQLYYEEELTMREIAEIFCLTVTRISQIHTAAILKLRRAMTTAQSPLKLEHPAAAQLHKNSNAPTAMRVG